MDKKLEMNLPGLSEYLYEQGVDENTTSEEIARLKKEYDKRYHALYRRSDKKAVQVRLTLKEYHKFQRLAKAYQFKGVSPALRKFALSYTEKKYIVPDKGTVEGLTKAIRRVGQNINLIVRSALRMKKLPSHRDYSTLRDNVEEIAFMVKRYYDAPPEQGVIKSVIKKTPEKEPITAKAAYDFLNTYLQNHPQDIHHFQTLLDSLKR